jgi:hypothetical protein
LNADRPAPIITHVNADPASGIGKLIDQRLLDVQLDAVSLQREVFAVVYGFADPTDRPFDLVSSPEDCATCEDAHNTAELGDECGLRFGNSYRFRLIHSILSVRSLAR